MRGRPKAELVLSHSEREQLQALTLRRKTAQAVALRARIVLACADGMDNKAVAARQRVTQQTVCKWRRRFVEQRMDGLLDAPRPGAPRSIDDARVDAVVAKTLESLPKGATHWSTRTMAREMGLSQTAITRIWHAFGLQPHRQETFKLSSDPLFVEKVRDIVGLYLDPPLKAMVLCVDEKSQIQALNRTQPILPMRPGLPEKATHDYKRNGTTTLFAALNVATGVVVDRCYDRHGKAEFLDFMKTVAKAYPRRKLHIVCDNYHTHKHDDINAWLAKNPRVTMHFTPTSGSWLNLVEVFFGIITRQAIRRGSFDSVRELVTAIREFIAGWNDRCHPFVWTKPADEILAHAKRQPTSDARH